MAWGFERARSLRGRPPDIVVPATLLSAGTTAFLQGYSLKRAVGSRWICSTSPTSQVR
jgi:hypothetical protein